VLRHACRKLFEIKLPLPYCQGEFRFCLTVNAKSKSKRGMSIFYIVRLSPSS
jgi:hypothetical protein